MPSRARSYEGRGVTSFAPELHRAPPDRRARPSGIGAGWSFPRRSGPGARCRSRPGPPGRSPGACGCLRSTGRVRARSASAPQVHVDHARILPDDVHRALRQDPPLVQHGHLPRRCCPRSACRAPRPPASAFRPASARSSPVRAVSSSLIPATGSSRSRSPGSWTSSMPISSHCFSPWERRSASVRALPRRPIEPEHLVDARLLLGASGGPGAWAPPACPSSAPARDSRTRCGPGRWWASGTCDRCRRARSPPRTSG